MYNLLVRWVDKSVMSRMVTERQLRGLMGNLKGGVSYAHVVTPSGVTKDITNIMNQ